MSVAIFSGPGYGGGAIWGTTSDWPAAGPGGGADACSRGNPSFSERETGLA